MRTPVESRGPWDMRWTIACDRCDATAAELTTTTEQRDEAAAHAQMLLKARGGGWLIEDGWQVCPRCADDHPADDPPAEDHPAPDHPAADQPAGG